MLLINKIILLKKGFPDPMNRKRKVDPTVHMRVIFQGRNTNHVLVTLHRLPFKVPRNSPIPDDHYYTTYIDRLQAANINFFDPFANPETRFISLKTNNYVDIAWSLVDFGICPPEDLHVSVDFGNGGKLINLIPTVNESGIFSLKISS